MIILSSPFHSSTFVWVLQIEHELFSFPTMCFHLELSCCCPELFFIFNYQDKYGVSSLGSEIVRLRTVGKSSQGWEDLIPVELANDCYTHPLNTNPITVKTSRGKTDMRLSHCHKIGVSSCCQVSQVLGNPGRQHPWLPNKKENGLCLFIIFLICYNYKTTQLLNDL